MLVLLRHRERNQTDKQRDFMKRQALKEIFVNPIKVECITFCVQAVIFQKYETGNESDDNYLIVNWLFCISSLDK